MKRRLLGLAILFIVPMAQAQLYHCEVDAKPGFSQTPCAFDARLTKVRPIFAYGGAAEYETAMTAEVWERIQINKLKWRIRRHEKRISEYQHVREQEVERLKQEKARANNTLGEEVWDKELAIEIWAVESKWQSLIDEEYRRIKELRSEIGQVRFEADMRRRQEAAARGRGPGSI